ncbi:MAG TPA: sugar ABC transporter ATP-binding protein [Anaerolineae bacterium]
MSLATVQMQGITKTFYHVPALDHVDFELRQGEIHALLGENGAGKSTLMKILRGIYIPDSGQITLQGKPVRFNSPNEAGANGIAMVFQEFSLIPTLTVAQNIFLTREARNRIGLLDDRACERKALALFREMGVEIDPRTPVAQLSTGYRQLTEIATALSQDARILILDEPTASLTHDETMALFKLMRRLKERGVSMIYISHRMEEIFQIADRITVLRDGRHVITDDVAHLNIQQVIEHILGRKAKSALKWQEHTLDQSREPLLEVKNLTCYSGVQGVSFRLYAGQVLGLAGLMGSGRTELVQAIFGINRIKSGEVRVHGRKLSIRRPENSMMARIALIPEDRRVQGLILNHALRDNFLLPLLKLGRLTRRSGLVDDREGNQLTATFIQKLRIRASSIFKPVRLLSGGNQQKVVIAKWLSTDPDIFLMDEPTAGVDIGTKGEILDMVRQLADAGKGIILISSEVQELLTVCDRILILKKGQISQELDRREIPTEEKLHHILQGAQVA